MIGFGDDDSRRLYVVAVSLLIKLLLTRVKNDLMVHLRLLVNRIPATLLIR